MFFLRNHVIERVFAVFGKSDYKGKQKEIVEAAVNGTRRSYICERQVSRSLGLIIIERFGCPCHRADGDGKGEHFPLFRIQVRINPHTRAFASKYQRLWRRWILYSLLMTS